MTTTDKKARDKDISHLDHHLDFDTDQRFNQLPSPLISIGYCGDRREMEASKEHLDELNLLISSYGAEITKSELVFLRSIDPRIWMGKGKAQEIKDKIDETKAKAIIIDDELSPSQQRNLEELLGCPVADRTEIILGVFAHHAKTKEARIQVSLAQAQYLLPRLKRMWTHLSRQRGGGVNQKGEGESQLEIDKRLLQAKMERYRTHLKEIEHHRCQQNRARKRSGIPVVAIVGYTNAGKSTLLNALTDAEVFVEDKLFATLDTTTRKFTLPNEQELLLVDTVGFIRKLPHGLVAAFRSTLEQSTQADLLIHLVDASSCNINEHLTTTVKVLSELQASEIPRILVFNKSDRLTEEEKEKISIEYGPSLFISAEKSQGLDSLFSSIADELSKRRAHLHILLPYSESALVALAHEIAQVTEKNYLDEGIELYLSVNNDQAHHFSSYSCD